MTNSTGYVTVCHLDLLSWVAQDWCLCERGGGLIPMELLLKWQWSLNGGASHMPGRSDSRHIPTFCVDWPGTWRLHCKPQAVVMLPGGFSQVPRNEDTLEGMKNRDVVTCLFRRGINYKVELSKRKGLSMLAWIWCKEKVDAVKHLTALYWKNPSSSHATQIDLYIDDTISMYIYNLCEQIT